MTQEQLIAAGISGAFAGAVGAAAGTLGGTIAMSIGASSKGITAIGMSGLISGAGGYAGQTYANLYDPCHASNPYNAALFAGVGGGAAKYFPTKTYNTIEQTNYFAPKKLGGLFGTKNSRLYQGSLWTSGLMGAGSNMGVPFS